MDEQEHSPAPTAPPWRSRGYLPHFDRPGLVQAITYRLADALPSSVIARWLRELANQPDDERDIILQHRAQAYLDAGMGSCVLRQSACAQIVEGNLLQFDRARYRLLAWVVMPNHVHVVIQTLPGWTLSRIVHGWKSYSAHRMPGVMEPPPACRRRSRLWQREYWDRFIRDEEHFNDAVRYVHGNPVKARLVSSPEGWRWSSAWSGREG